MGRPAESHASIGAAHEPVYLTPPAWQLALRAETCMLAAKIQEYATILTKLADPPSLLEELPSLGFGPYPIRETQPYITVGVYGGAQPSRGRCMLDTGSGFTMTTTLVCREHGLQVRPFHGTY